MPTLPALVTMKLVAVEEPMTKDGPVMPLGLMESCAQGVVVPTPTKPPYGFRRMLLVVPAEPMVKLPEAEPIGPAKVVVAVEEKATAPEVARKMLEVAVSSLVSLK